MKLLTVAEAADTFHVSVGTVRALCKTRKLRHERPGLGRGVIRIPEDAIEEYRKSVTIGTTAREGEGQKPPPPRPVMQLNHLRLRGGG
jgi:excisionase family DNA binding protein